MKDKIIIRNKMYDWHRLCTFDLMYRNYLKTALRNISRNKVYSAINLAGLAIGLACAMLILLYVKDELSYDRFHKQAAHIYRIDRKIVRDNGNIDKSGYTGYLQGPRFAAQIPGIKAYARFLQNQVDIKKDGHVQSQQVFLTDSNFFSVFDFPAVAGNTKTAFQSANSVVITETMAKRQFGNTQAVGKTLLMKKGDQFENFVVTAVTRDCPQNSSLQFEMLMPLQVPAAELSKSENWFNSFLNTFIVLDEHANEQATDAKMQQVFLSDAAESIAMIKSKYGIKDLGLSFFLQPLPTIHLSSDAGAEAPLANASKPVFSYVLSAMAAFILLIACINFVNLTVAQSAKRAKEIGIRKVIGGMRKQLVVQFLFESFGLCLLAFIMAIFILQMFLPFFNQLANKQLALSYLFDAKLVLGYIGLFFVTGILAGVYPALVLSKYNPVQVLYARFSLAKKNLLQVSLVVFQFAFASFLIIAALVIYLQFDFLTSQTLGYDDSNLVMIDKGNLSHADAAAIKQRLMSIPGIVGVAPKNSGFAGNTVKVNGEQKVNVTVETIDTSYLSMIGVPIVAGRNFSAAYATDSTNSVIVNEAFVKEAGWNDPVGKTIAVFDKNKTYNVIGVSRDYHFRPLTSKIEPQFFTMNPDNAYGMVNIRIRPGSESKVMPAIERVFMNMFPLDAYSYEFKDRVNAESYVSEARWKKITLFAAILTIFISCIGLFGLSVMMAEKRTKEIGVRKVLGASVGGVVAMLSRQFVKMIIVALILAIPAAWLAADKWLQNYPYRIALGWTVFAVAGVLVLVVALATISFQAFKAANANPVSSLKGE